LEEVVLQIPNVMQAVVTVEYGGNFVSKAIQQQQCVGAPPDLLANQENASGVVSSRPDIFLALESFRHSGDHAFINLGSPRPPPEEMSPKEPILFHDYFEPLETGAQDPFRVQVPHDYVWNKKRNQVQLPQNECAFRKNDAKTPKCRCSNTDCSTCDSDEPSSASKLITNYQINILRKTCIRAGLQDGSLDLSGSFDKDSTSKRKPFERKNTSEFESVASNNTNTTDCDEKTARRNHKRNGPADLIRSYSLGHERSRQKLNGAFKKFSLPTPAYQGKDAGAGSHGAAGSSDQRKVSTLARHYYPEGGWGIVVACCSVLVHILCHGLQLSSGVLITPTVAHFKGNIILAGKFLTLSFQYFIH